MAQIKCSILNCNYDVNLSNGSLAHCCRFKPIQFNRSEFEKLNYRYLDFNSETYKARQDLENGIQTPKCNDCWTFENQNLPSWRLQKNHDRTDFVSINLQFSTLCNQSCFYCGHEVSTTIASYGQWINSRNGDIFTIPQTKQRPPAIKFDHIIDFVKNLPKHITELSLSVSGGEPMLLENFENDIVTLAEVFLSLNDNNKVSIGFSTNTNTKPEKTALFYEKFNNSRIRDKVTLNIVTSVENLEERAEYVRDGLVWSNFLENFKIHNAMADLHSIRLTVNPFTIVNIVDFVKYFVYYNVDFFYNYPFQRFFQIGVLDKRFISEAQKLEDYVTSKNIEFKFEKKFYKDLSILMQDDKPNAKIFRKAITNHDQIKNKNWRTVFPEYIDWFDSIE